jgi:tRNA threonylcarbamoyladenosine biosynthesis protein TsaB
MVYVLILALDTSSASGSLSVLRDEAIIGCVSTWTREAYSSRMFRQLQFLLDELSLKLDAIDLFAVSAGPGSFTGLRVGLAAAKGWGEAYGKSIAAVSALEAVAMQSHATTQILIPAFDARRGEIYFGFYGRKELSDGGELALDEEECSMPPAEFADFVIGCSVRKKVTIVTPTPEVFSEVASRFEKNKVPIERVSYVLAPWIGLIGLRLAREGKLYDSISLSANYVRRSDAEVRSQGTSGT